MTLVFLSLLLLSLTTATPLIHLDLDYESFLKRSNPTWKWGSSLNKTGPTEWVSSLFGGNGNLGYQLYSPTPTTLQLDISSKLLWDDRTPDLVTPPSISKQNLTYYTGNFVKDQPRLPSGHFIITWNDNQTAPILAVGHMSLYNARAELNITTSTSETGFSLVAWVSAAYEIADVVVVEIKPFGNNAGLPSVTFVPADLTQEPSCSHCVHNPSILPLNTSQISSTTQMTTIIQPHLKGTSHATSYSNTTIDNNAMYIVSLSPVLASNELASNYVSDQIQAALNMGPVTALKKEHEAWWHTWWPNGGFLTLDYSILESFWYIQLYKFACAARKGRGVHDLMGPWYIKGTPWVGLSFLDSNTAATILTRTNVYVFFLMFINNWYCYLLYRHLLYRHLLYLHLLYCHWLTSQSTRPSLDLRSPSAARSTLGYEFATDLLFTLRSQ